jgi:hypothetical protein
MKVLWGFDAFALIMGTFYIVATVRYQRALDAFTARTRDLMNSMLPEDIRKELERIAGDGYDVGGRGGQLMADAFRRRFSVPDSLLARFLYEIRVVMESATEIMGDDPKLAFDAVYESISSAAVELSSLERELAQ